MPYDPCRPPRPMQKRIQTTTYEYLDNGALYRRNYLNQAVSTYAYDFGRTSTVTSAYGRTVTYQYDLNSALRPLPEGHGTISYAYDNMGNTTAVLISPKDLYLLVTITERIY